MLFLAGQTVNGSVLGLDIVRHFQLNQLKALFREAHGQRAAVFRMGATFNKSGLFQLVDPGI